MSDTTNACDFLEVKSFDKSEELVLGVLNGVIDEPVGEEDRVVGQLDLANCLFDAYLELLLRLNSVSDAAA